jgi:hypothetical protein
MTVEEHIQALRELIARDQEDIIAGRQAKADSAHNESDRVWYQRQADRMRAIPYPWGREPPVNPAVCRLRRAGRTASSGAALPRIAFLTRSWRGGRRWGISAAHVGHGRTESPLRTVRMR